MFNAIMRGQNSVNNFYSVEKRFEVQEIVIIYVVPTCAISS